MRILQLNLRHQVLHSAYDGTLHHPSHLAHAIDEAGHGSTQSWLASLSDLKTEQHISTSYITYLVINTFTFYN